MDELRAYGMTEETGGIARQLVRKLVQTADGPPPMHTVHPANPSSASRSMPMI